MANPYRTGLEQFLALEEAKTKERIDAEEAAREKDRRENSTNNLIDD